MITRHKTWPSIFLLFLGPAFVPNLIAAETSLPSIITQRGVCDGYERATNNLPVSAKVLDRYNDVLALPLDELITEGKKGDNRALVGAAILIFRSERMQHSTNEALDYLSQAASHGEPLALYLDGSLKRQGNLTPQDLQGAHKDFVRAAKEEFAPAMKSLAVDYLIGSGVAINFGEAAKWAKSAVKHGDISGNQTLAMIYREGLGVTPDLNKAFDLVKQSSASGDPVSRYDLARAYYFGEGTPRNPSMAYSLARSAYCAGVKPAGFIVAQELLGQGKKGENVSTALRILEDLAADNNGDACLAVADVYLSSEYDRRDPNKAIFYLRCAANAGLVRGKYLYGATLLRYGKNHDDFLLAQRYLTEAANSGNADAAFDLGVAYQRGVEFQGDTQKARYWLKIAAERGNQSAAQLLKTVN